MHCAISPLYAPSTAHCKISASTSVARRTVAAIPRPCPSRKSQVRWGSRVKGAAVEISSPPAAAPPLITITDAALKNLKRLREEAGNEKLLLRMGVRSGGCSGMSYHMDFEAEENVRPEDMVMEYEGGFKLVCDPKSGLYLFGMSLDYSSALIGGGFQFHNPNAASSCGCGKSFGV